MPSIVVVGSINLDIVATAPCLPVPGETVTDAVLARYPGGKGANQALAARRRSVRSWHLWMRWRGRWPSSRASRASTWLPRRRAAGR
jgi:hypothetical protein